MAQDATLYTVNNWELTLFVQQSKDLCLCTNLHVAPIVICTVIIRLEYLCACVHVCTQIKNNNYYVFTLDKSFRENHSKSSYQASLTKKGRVTKVLSFDNQIIINVRLAHTLVIICWASPSNQSFYRQIASYQRGIGYHRVGQWWEGITDQ